MPPAFFESERLWYRAPELSDGSTLVRWMNDPRVRLHLGNGRFPLNHLAEEAWVKKVSTPPGELRTDVVFLFGPKEGEGPIGSAGIHRIDWISRDGEWGILIGEVDRWNQGFGREVGRRMLRYAFEELNLHRVRLRVNASNEAGVRSYEAVGFVHEGRLRQASFINGRYEDLVLMSFLRDEWKPDSR